MNNSYNQGYWDTDNLLRLEFSEPMIETLIRLASQQAKSMKYYEQGCTDRLAEFEKNSREQIPSLKNLG
jgi:hypothetical protein